MVKARIGTDGTVGMMVRMSEELRDRIKAAAENNGRSQNSEIVTTLEEKYPKPAGDDYRIMNIAFKLMQAVPAHRSMDVVKHIPSIFQEAERGGAEAGLKKAMEIYETLSGKPAVVAFPSLLSDIASKYKSQPEG